MKQGSFFLLRLTPRIVHHKSSVSMRMISSSSLLISVFKRSIIKIGNPTSSVVRSKVDTAFDVQPHKMLEQAIITLACDLLSFFLQEIVHIVNVRFEFRHLYAFRVLCSTS